MSVKGEIEKLNAKFGELVRKGDAKGVSELYTSDAVLMPLGTGPVTGRKGVEEFWGGAIKGMGLLDAKLTTLDVVGSGDSASERGEYLLKLKGGGEDRGKYVVVWKKGKGGWMLHWDIWTSSLPPK